MDVIELIKKHEGLRLKPYRCTAGKLTIGYGRNLDDNGISKEEADFLLRHDIQDAIEDLHKVFTSKELESFFDSQVAALIDMIFNLGLTRFQKFERLINAMKRGDWNEASKQALLSTWANQVGARAIEDATLLQAGKEEI